MQDIRAQLLAAFEAEHRDHLAAMRDAFAKAAQGRAYDLKDVFRRAHSLKGAARAVDLPMIEDLAHRLEAVLQRALDEEASLAPGDLRVLEMGLDAIEASAADVAAGRAPADPATARAALDALLAGEPPAPAAAPAPEPAPAEPAATEEDGERIAYLRVDAAQVDGLSEAMHRLGETLRADPTDDVLHKIDVDLAGLMRIVGADARRRIEATRNELAVARRARRQAAATLQQQAQRVRQGVDRLSLVPVDTIFGNFGRLFRELARSEGVDAEVQVAGLDLQADRRVLQTLKDPVLHILRNVLSHAAEPPERRAAQGKPPALNVVLAFRAKGGRLHVSVKDDGRGPDLARLEAAAIERGLLPARPPGAPPPPEDRLLALAFEPNLSTAAAVDRMAGRGMGLSVAAEAARRMRGHVQLRANRPWGAEVVLTAPLIASRQSLLLVRAGAQDFGLPTHAVEGLLRLPVSAIENVEGRPATRVRREGREVTAPLVALTAILHGGAEPLPVENGHVKAVLLRRGLRLCAVAVDEFMDVRTTNVEALPAAGDLAALAGGAVPTGAGRPAIALNPEALVERWLRGQAHVSGGRFGLAEALPQPARAQATILVVDDSITTRTLEKSILEAQGYRVLLSVDGLDALNRLRSGEAVIDLVVADVEMPRMDGFSLLSAIKTDPGLASIPVLLMTSRADDEDIRKGLELGAAAYLTKQSFDQRDLLAAIGGLL